MNKKYLAACGFAMLCFAGLTSCQKDRSLSDSQLKLLAESYTNDSKLLANGTNLTWITGDKVLLNNDTVCTVNVYDAEGAIIEGGSFTAPFSAISPASIYVSNSGNTYTINIPSNVTYDEVEGVQNVKAPLAAYQESGNELHFKHLTAAMVIGINNPTNAPLYLDELKIVNTKYQLCGEKSFNITNIPGTMIGGNAPAGSNDSLRTITMTFANNVYTVAANSTKYIQVPVYPLRSNASQFTITLKSHYAGGVPTTNIIFNRTQPSAVDNTLPVATMGFVPVKIESGADNVYNTGLFSVSATKQVQFSKGNLQYKPSTNTWRFAPAQTQALTTQNVDLSATKSTWIDLFGWATSGKHQANGEAVNPYDTTKTNNHYYVWGHPSLHMFGTQGGDAGVDGDWGSNTINGATGSWRTLTGDEWRYLLEERQTTAIREGNLQSQVSYYGENPRWCIATVNGVNGMMIFPDHYTHPASLSRGIPGSINTPVAYGVTNIFTSEQWAEFEKAGMVFLPATGFRIGNVYWVRGYGEYWASTRSETYYSYNAQSLHFQSGQYGGVVDKERHNGFAVRLVRDAK